MKEITAVAHANLAFVKYWGKADHELNIPLNGSISMNLSAAKTTTTVKFNSNLTNDEVIVNGTAFSADSKLAQRISKHMDRIRSKAMINTFAEIKTVNSFPMSAGFASSASGFAALTLAGTKASGIDLTEKELSILARQGSGSASRSIPSGFVEWIAGSKSENSFSFQIAPPSHWQIADVAVVVSKKPKAVSSTKGHKLALSSPFWDTRQIMLKERLDNVRTAIKNRDFPTFGKEVEQEAISLHAIAMTSSYYANSNWYSGVYYWEPETIELLSAVQTWRTNGIEVYFTLDAGATVHLLCERENIDKVVQATKETMRGRDWELVISKPAPGAYIVSDNDIYLELAREVLQTMGIIYQENDSLGQLLSKIHSAMPLAADSTELEIQKLSTKIAHKIQNQDAQSTIMSLLEKLKFEISFLPFE